MGRSGGGGGFSGGGGFGGGFGSSGGGFGGGFLAARVGRPLGRATVALVSAGVPWRWLLPGRLRGGSFWGGFLGGLMGSSRGGGGGSVPPQMSPQPGGRSSPGRATAPAAMARNLVPLRASPPTADAAPCSSSLRPCCSCCWWWPWVAAAARARMPRIHGGAHGPSCWIREQRPATSPTRTATGSTTRRSSNAACAISTRNGRAALRVHLAERVGALLPELQSIAQEKYDELFTDQAHFVLVFCDDGNGRSTPPTGPVR